MRNKYFLCLASFLIFSFLFTGSAFAIAQQRVVIPYAVENDRWWTGIAVQNPTNETMYCYISIYDEDGELIDGGCFTVDPKAIYADSIDTFVSATVEGRVSIYIQTNVGDGWTTPFSVTMFMGNNESGFGMQTFESEDYDSMLIICGIILPPFTF